MKDLKTVMGWVLAVALATGVFGCNSGSNDPTDSGSDAADGSGEDDLPDEDTSCESATDCRGDPGPGCSWVCNQQKRCEASCPVCDGDPSGCQGEPGAGCVWGCTTDWKCTPECRPCIADLEGTCSESPECGFDFIPYGEALCDGEPCCATGQTCCVPDPHFCDQQGEPFACVPAEQECPAGYPRYWSAGVCRDLPNGRCCFPNPRCNETAECTYVGGDCCVDLAPYKQCLPCPGLCAQTRAMAGCVAQCDAPLQISDVECGGACCEDPAKPLCCDHNSCLTRRDCIEPDDCCADSHCATCQGIPCDSKEDCGPDDDVCCTGNRCQVCP